MSACGWKRSRHPDESRRGCKASLFCHGRSRRPSGRRGTRRRCPSGRTADRAACVAPMRRGRILPSTATIAPTPSGPIQAASSNARVGQRRRPLQRLRQRAAPKGGWSCVPMTRRGRSSASVPRWAAALRRCVAAVLTHGRLAFSRTAWRMKVEHARSRHAEERQPRRAGSGVCRRGRRVRRASRSGRRRSAVRGHGAAHAGETPCPCRSSLAQRRALGSRSS